MVITRNHHSVQDGPLLVLCCPRPGPVSHMWCIVALGEDRLLLYNYIYALPGALFDAMTLANMHGHSLSGPQ